MTSVLNLPVVQIDANFVADLEFAIAGLLVRSAMDVI